MFPLYDIEKAPKFPFVTIGIILVTAFAFFLELTVSDPDGFIAQFALIPSHVNFGNLISLIPFITAIFLHGGFLHIISNLWFLWIFGDNVEAYLGRLQYIFLYFTAGIAGNFLQYILMPASDIPMLGASGAIAGVLGAYFILFPRHRVKTIVPFGFLFVTEVPAVVMLGYWFVLQIFSGVASLPAASGTGGVAFLAHIGGFIVGMILAKTLKPAYKEPNQVWES